MESKKNSKADLENKKSIYLKTGFIISLGIALFAFEWKTSDSIDQKLRTTNFENVDEEIIPITRTPEPEIIKPLVVTRLNIVTDDTEIKNEPIIISTETNPDDSVLVVVQKPEVVDDDIPIYVSEISASFPGGDEALHNFLVNNLKYPDEARINNVAGIVYVTFVINKKGKITNIEIPRKLGFGLDDEALRVLNLMPDWNSGTQNGKPVSVYFTLPIKFTLRH